MAGCPRSHPTETSNRDWPENEHCQVAADRTEKFVSDHMPSEDPTDLSKRKLGDTFLAELSTRIVACWSKLAIWLKVNVDFINAELLISPEKLSCDMLQKWVENCEGTHIDFAPLYSALVRMNRNDLASIVSDECHEGSLLHIDKVNIVFAKLSPHLSKDWYPLGIELDIRMDELDSIQKSKAYTHPVTPALRMLKRWNESFHEVSSSRLDVLLNALEAVKRKDIREWVKAQQNIYAQPPQHTVNQRNIQPRSRSLDGLPDGIKQTNLSGEVVYTIAKQPSDSYDVVDGSARRKDQGDAESHDDSGEESSATSYKSGKSLASSATENTERYIQGVSKRSPAMPCPQLECLDLSEEVSGPLEANSTTPC